MHVLMRADASERIGTGHVMRCLTLADEIKRNQGKVTFISRDFHGQMAEKVRRNGHEVILLPAVDDAYMPVAGEPAHAAWLGVSWQEDMGDTKGSIEDRVYDWLIVDHYAIDYRWHRKARTFSKKIMVIDDLADRSLDCDLLLDQTYGREKEAYVSLIPSGCQLFTGAQYALLRPQFAEIRPQALKLRKHFQGIRRILVFMGGADMGNTTSLILDILAMVSYLHPPVIDVILGSKCHHIAEVTSKAITHPFKVNVLCDINNMAEKMLHADIAIGAGGTASWERCCLGLPTAIIVTADNQLVIAQNVSLAGAACVMKHTEIEASLVNFLDEIDSNTKQYKEMSKRAFGLCSGNGVYAVAAALRS